MSTLRQATVLGGTLALGLGFALPAHAAPIERELHYVVTVEAQQTWEKHEPKTGEEWSKATSTQHYEVTTRLISDGKLEVRNLQALNLDERMEAKIVYLARRAKKEFEASGQPFHLPKTEAERQAFSNRRQADEFKCQKDLQCYSDVELRYASILAAVDWPEALEDETVPGTFFYFVPYRGCPEKSRVTLEIQIDGMRYNKDDKKVIPFSEHHSADTTDASDGTWLCQHFGATIDTQDKNKSMYLDNVFIPRPIGISTFTESGHTSRTPEPQSVPTAVVEWLAATLRHAPPSGSASAVVPLILPLNANATWLGLWKGSAKVAFTWSFTEVPSTSPPAKLSS